jgi:hypothetical protein
MLLSLLLFGCGAGGIKKENPETSSTSLSTSQAYNVSTDTNQSLSRVLQKASLHIGNIPSSDNQTSSIETGTSRSLNRLPSTETRFYRDSSRNGYTVRDLALAGTQSNIYITLRYFDAFQQPLENNLTKAKYATIIIDGFETIDGIKYNYDKVELNSTLRNFTSIILNGTGSVSNDQGAVFSLNVNNLEFDLQSYSFLNGEATISGKDDENTVIATTQFNNNGFSTRVLRNNSQVELQEGELPSVSVLENKHTFMFNSAQLKHENLDGLLTNRKASYSGSTQRGTSRTPIRMTIQQPNGFLNICGVQTRKVHLPAINNGEATINEYYLAQDTDGNLFSFGKNGNYLLQCQAPDLFMPSETSNGTYWKDSDSDEQYHYVSSTNLYYRGFRNATRVDSGDETNSVSHYWNQANGLIAIEATSNEQTTELIQIQETDQYYQ